MFTNINSMQKYGVAIGREVFGDENMDNKAERLMRFGEEAMELLQAGDVTEEQAYQIVGYVFGRPKETDISKEFAGCQLTLLSCADAHKIDVALAFDTEARRVLAKKDACRAKHDAKPASVRAAA